MGRSHFDLFSDPLNALFNFATGYWIKESDDDE